MKITFITIALLFITMLSYSQNEKSYVEELYNSKTKEFGLYVSNNLVLTSHNRTKALQICPIVNKDSTFSVLFVIAHNVGSCCQNDQITILFTNGDFLTATSFKGLNCEGKSFFSFSKDDWDKLRTIPILAINLINGHSFEYFTQKTTKMQSEYFIQLYESLNK
jgi:hypothetical protein